MSSTKGKPEPINVLFRTKSGPSGYVSYLAACDMNESFSEYKLYETIWRILTARRYGVEYKVESPWVDQPATGDRKRLDVVATGPGLQFALAIKWAQTTSLNVGKAYEKLAAFRRTKKPRPGFFCVFGKGSIVANVRHTTACTGSPLSPIPD